MHVKDSAALATITGGESEEAFLRSFAQPIATVLRNAMKAVYRWTGEDKCPDHMVVFLDDSGDVAFAYGPA